MGCEQVCSGHFGKCCPLGAPWQQMQGRTCCRTQPVPERRTGHDAAYSRPRRCREVASKARVFLSSSQKSLSAHNLQPSAGRIPVEPYLQFLLMPCLVLIIRHSARGRPPVGWLSGCSDEGKLQDLSSAALVQDQSQREKCQKQPWRILWKLGRLWLSDAPIKG